MLSGATFSLPLSLSPDPLLSFPPDLLSPSPAGDEEGRQPHPQQEAVAAGQHCRWRAAVVVLVIMAVVDLEEADGRGAAA